MRDYSGRLSKDYVLSGFKTNDLQLRDKCGAELCYNSLGISWAEWSEAKNGPFFCHHLNFLPNWDTYQIWVSIHIMSYPCTMEIESYIETQSYLIDIARFFKRGGGQRAWMEVIVLQCMLSAACRNSRSGLCCLPETAASTVDWKRGNFKCPVKTKGGGESSELLPPPRARHPYNVLHLYFSRGKKELDTLKAQCG